MGERITEKLESIPHVGLLFALVAALCDSFAGVTLKALHPIPALPIIMYRNVVLFAIMFPMMMYTRPPLLPLRLMPIITFRSLTNGGNAVLAYFSYQLIDVGDASSIYALAPTFTIILAVIVLKEKLT